MTPSPPWPRQGVFFGNLNSTIRLLLAFLLPAGAAAILYAPGLEGSFFFDDIPNIVTATELHLRELTAKNLLAVLANGHSGLSGRPVAQLSFALNHFFSGLSPYAYKATNLGIHILCAWLVAVLYSHLFDERLSSETRSTTASFIPVLAAAVWLLHPIQLLPVLHVVQRMTSLSALFLLLALILHIRGREKGELATVALGWLVFWPLAFLSKETGALFPLFALGWELTILREKRGRIDRFALALSLLILAALVGSGIYVISDNGQWLWAGYARRSFSPIERLLTEARVLWFYLGLIVFPRLESLGLYHDDFALSTGLLEPLTTLTSLTGLVGLVLLAGRLRSRAPLVCLGIIWFLTGHLLESTVLPLELVHEHRNYFPTLGILLALAASFRYSLANPGPVRTVAISLAAGAVAWCSLITGIRAHQFGDEIRRTQIEAQHHRASPRAQFDAGKAFLSLPEAEDSTNPAYSLAREHFRLASSLDQNSKTGLLGMIHIACRADLSPDYDSLRELAHRLKATPFAPGDQSVLFALKEFTITSSPDCLTREQITDLFTAADQNPTATTQAKSIMRSWYADYLWLGQKDLKGAMAALKSSLALISTNPSNQLKWAQLVYISGDLREAKKLLLPLREARLTAEERKTLEDIRVSLEVAER